MFRKCSQNLLATSSYAELCLPSSSAMASIFSEKIAIQLVPSDCSRWPPVGRGLLRSKTPMLSRPRKPPEKMLLPPTSLRLTHQVKFSDNFLKQNLRNRKSPRPPRRCFSKLYTFQTAKGCTGGLTSPKFHS